MKVRLGPYRNYNKKTKKTPARTIKIELDRWDTWSVDHTIGLLVVPLLKQLRKTKHGSPFTDDEDVPEKYRSTSAKKKANEETFEPDSNHFKRWDWILGEMIWGFTQLTIDWEKKYHSGKVDLKWKELPDGKGYEMMKGPKDTHKFDREGYIAHRERIQKALGLFAKYAMALWD